MEKTEIKISIDNERLEALTYFLQKKETSSLQKELGKILEELYEKTVPPDVRDYIDGRQKKAAPPKPKVKALPKGGTGANAERTDEKD